MSEKGNIITGKNLLQFFKKIGMLLLVLSPILLFFFGTVIYQLLIPNAKDPFVNFSGLDPRTGVFITWETEETESSTVWYGKDSSTLSSIKTDSQLVTIHHLNLTSLEPNTKYYYRVGVAGVDPIYRSEVFSFKTAPNDTSTNFNFAAYSDSQIFFGIGYHRRVCDAIARHEDLSFVSIAGDLAQNWDYKPDWNQFFFDGTSYLRKIPIVPTMGNHDDPGDDDYDSENFWYKNYFGATNATSNPPKFNYAFNWSNTLIIMAGIHSGGDENKGTPESIEHDIWMNKTLENAQDKAFRIIMFHRNVFSFEYDQETMIDRIVPIVEKYNVSLVMYGHTHHYGRFLYNNHTYICLGGGGSPQFGGFYFRTHPYGKVFALGPSYTKFNIRADMIIGTTYTPEDDILDTFTLQLQGSNAILQE